MDKHKKAIWALTERGIRSAVACAAKLDAATLFVPARHKMKSDPLSVMAFDKFSRCFADNFKAYDAHFCVMASGIVVRAIAPLLEDKTTDPAVVVADEALKHVISLVSGHLGGANDLCLKIAAVTGADPVITTATDNQGILALDTLAQKIGAAVENKEKIKIVSTAMLNGLPVALVCEQSLYERFYQNTPHPPDYFKEPINVDIESYAAVCIISEKVHKVQPGLLQKTLLIRPSNLVVGIGCNKNTAETEISEAVKRVFDDHKLSLLSVAEIATVKEKKTEAGLVAFARTMGKRLGWHSTDVLNGVNAPNMSPPSVYAQKHIQAKGVAEPAALKTAGANARLVVPKQKIGNVTVAVAKKSVSATLKILDNIP